jgi:hypothetical protein
VALTPARVNFGGGGAQGGQRPEQPGGQERKRKPIEVPERARWLEGSQLACEVQRRGPDTLGVNVAEREGDRQEWGLDARRRVPAERAACIIRAQCERRLAPEPAPRSWGEVRQKARPVTLSVGIQRVTVQGARRPGSRLPPVEVGAVYAKAGRPPSGAEPIDGRWLTRRPGAEFPRACTVVQGYRCRWAIARFFRGRKPGGQIEP